MVYRSDCHYLPYSIHFSEFISRVNGQNTKILEVRHFRMIRKWPPRVILDAQSINTESLFKGDHPLYAPVSLKSKGEGAWNFGRGGSLISKGTQPIPDPKNAVFHASD